MGLKTLYGIYSKILFSFPILRDVSSFADYSLAPIKYLVIVL